MQEDVRARRAGGTRRFAGVRRFRDRFCFGDWNVTKEVMPRSCGAARIGKGPDARYGFAETLARTSSPVDGILHPPGLTSLEDAVGASR
jgi:hypothetical protein